MVVDGSKITTVTMLSMAGWILTRVPPLSLKCVRAAPGTVLAMAGDCLILSHTAANGVEFLTIYLHMDLSTVTHAVNAPVRRGELLGRTDPTQSPLHLHFGVAVQVRNGLTALNGVSIDGFWYFIDPWGVYDYRDKHYLPTKGRIFKKAIAGATHTVHWRAQPVFKNHSHRAIHRGV